MATILARLSGRTTQTDLPVQAAAVCYRRVSSSVEFLLVNTSSGKWTFPKGRINPGMSAGASAAQEAWEEAGAMGNVAEQQFDFYLDTKRALGHDAFSREIRIAAFLFEVHSTVTPLESGRNPNWFSARAAKKLLAEGRTSQYAKQITRIVDSAMDHLRTRQTRTRSVLLPSRRRLATAR